MPDFKMLTIFKNFESKICMIKMIYLMYESTSVLLHTYSMGTVLLHTYIHTGVYTVQYIKMGVMLMLATASTV